MQTTVSLNNKTYNLLNIFDIRQIIIIMVETFFNKAPVVEDPSKTFEDVTINGNLTSNKTTKLKTTIINGTSTTNGTSVINGTSTTNGDVTINGKLTLTNPGTPGGGDILCDDIVCDFITIGSNINVSASGTDISNVPTLTKQRNVITNSTGVAGCGVKLPGAAELTEIQVIHIAGGTIDLYPDYGQTINGNLLEIPYNIANNYSVTVIYLGSDKWQVIEKSDVS